MRNSALAGTDMAAAQRFFLRMMLRRSSLVMRCRPISSSVPTMARTMLRRNRLDCMVNVHVSPVCCHCACVTVQRLFLTSVCSLLKLVKSVVWSRICAALFMASKSVSGGMR